MGEPLADVFIAFAQAIMQNPVTASLVVGVVRTATGYLQSKYKDKTNKDFDKKEFAATLTKYLIAVNALTPLVPTEYQYAVPYVTLITDIAWSTVRKLKNGE